MKNLRNSFLICFLVLIHVGVNGQPCEKVISTNPDNPVNVPFSTVSPNKTNPWLNIFDISAAQNGNPPVAKDIKLNNEVSWQIPYWDQNLPLDMKNPYTTSGTVQDRYRYLRRSNIPFLVNDFHWEDGWELLYLLQQQKEIEVLKEKIEQN